jgi:hypothetical protein
LRHIESAAVPELRKLLEAKTERAAAEYVAARMKDSDSALDRAKRARSERNKQQARAESEMHLAAARIAWRDFAGKKSDPFKSADKSIRKEAKRAAESHYTYVMAQLRNVLSKDIGDLIRIASAETDLRTRFHRFDSTSRHSLHVSALSTRYTFTKKQVAEYEKLREQVTAHCQPFQDAALSAYNAMRAFDEQSEQEKVTAWLALETDTLPRIDRVICRVKGDNVETNKGARVPLEQAKALTRLAARCRARGAEYVNRDAIGHYHLDKITAQGDMKIGCHFIPWQSIADCVSRFVPDLLESAE